MNGGGGVGAFSVQNRRHGPSWRSGGTFAIAIGTVMWSAPWPRNRHIMNCNIDLRVAFVLFCAMAKLLVTTLDSEQTFACA